MKSQCECGNIIADDGRLQHKGRILREQSFAKAYEKPAAQVEDFIRAIREGRRKEWIDSFYGNPGVDIEDVSVLFDIISFSQERVGLDIYQCEACGRIFIEHAPQSFTHRTFKPEDEDWKGMMLDAGGNT